MFDRKPTFSKRRAAGTSRADIERSVGVVCEALERRTLMTGVNFNWIGGSGNWTDPANWFHTAPPFPEPDRSLPNTEDFVTIAPAAGSTITISTGFGFAVARSVNCTANLRLEHGANLSLFGGNLTINDHAEGESFLTLVSPAPSGGGTGVSFINNSNPRVTQSLAINGNGTVQGEGGGGDIALGILGTPADSLTIGTGITLRAVGQARLELRGVNLRNLGTIVSDAPTTFFGGVGFGKTQGGVAAQTITNSGTIRVTNGGIVQIAEGINTWRNSGSIEINGGTLRLGGRFRQSDLGNYTRVGGTIQLVGGTLLGNLTLTEQSGSWELNGGTLKGSRITRTGNQTFSFNSSAIFDACTLTFDVTVAGIQNLQIKNGLNLENATLRLNAGTLAVDGTQTIGGSGQIITSGGTGLIGLVGSGVRELTIASGVVLRTDTAAFSIGGTPADRLIVQGQLAALVGNSNINAVRVDIHGQLSVGGNLTASGAITLMPAGSLHLAATGNLSSSQPITGATTNAARSRVNGRLTVNGGNAALPAQLIEVMGADRGAVTDGYRDNFALGRLELSGNAEVRLQDSSDNAQGPGAEAMYVDMLVVPTGSTLDLNGLKLYTRISSIQGTITGGTVTQLADSGPILLGRPTSGNIGVAGQQDEWTFFGRAGQTISAILNPQVNGTSGSPGTLSPALGLGRISLLKPDGTVLGSAQGNNIAFTLPDQVLPENGVYKLRVQASTTDPNRTGNYNLAIYDVTTETRSYLLNTTASGNIETPFVRDRWTFALEAGQQIQFDLLAAQTSGLRFTLEGPDGFLAFNNIADDSTLLTIPGGRGGNYALTVKGQADETGSYSFVVRDGSITPLTLGAAFAGTLPGSGAPRWFSMTLPDPGQLLVTLDDATNTDRNQLYLRRGALPTQSEFDYRLPSFSADGTIYVPNAAAGDWFALLYGDHVPAPSTYTLKAEYSDLRITSITPDRYGIDNSMTMTLFGGGYEPGTTVKLVGGSTTINASAVEIDSFTQITATFDLSGAPLRAFNIVVERGALNFSLSNAFTTLENQPAKLETKLIMPGNATRTSVTSVVLEYANTGNVAMLAPLFTVQSNDPEGDQHPILTLDLTRTLEDFNSSTLPPGVSERIMALGSGTVPGVLNPGERMRIPINYLGEKPPFETTDQTLELQVKCVSPAAADAEDCGCGSPDSLGGIDWGSLKNVLKPPTVSAAVWDRVYADITDPLDTVEDYAAMLIVNARYLGRIGVRVLDIDDLWNLEVREALGTYTAIPVLASAVDAQVPVPGDALGFSRRFEDSVISRNIDGPFGFGWAVPWYATLSRDAADDVLTLNGSSGSQRVFLRDSRGNTILSLSGKYFSGAGDSSSMRRVSAGIFELREMSGTVTRFRADGKINYIEDPRGNRVTLGYNGSGRLVTLTHTSGASISVGYNAAGHITTVNDSFGRSTTYTYDAAEEHLLSAIADDGTTVSYTYDTTSDVLRRHTMLSISGSGTTRSFTYDARGRLASTALAGNVSPVSLAYTHGRITITDAGGSNQAFFDHRGRVAKVTDARGFSALAQYDENDRIIRNTRPDGSAGEYEWCDCGSLEGFTNELGNTTQYETSGSPFKDVTAIIDPKGNRSRFTYDSAGNIVSTIFADGSIESLGNYTPSGLPQLFTNRRGQATAFTYNAAGQITKRTRPTGEFIEYFYDARGRITTVTEGNANTTFEYDTAIDGDRVRRITYPNGNFLEYDYDSFGRRTAVRDHTGYTTRYEFDAAGRLLRARDTANAILATYSYDAAGRTSRVHHANDTFTTYSYDVAGNVLTIDNFKSPGVLNSFFHSTYDSRNQRISQATIDGTWSYGYDAAGQLISATLASTNGSIPNQNIQISYDDAGNREFVTQNGQLIDYGSNELNQITSVDGVQQSYDLDGNLTFDGQNSFSYDELNRLTLIDDGSTNTQFVYDALDFLNATIKNGVTTGYLRDLYGIQQPLAEFDGANAVSARNIYAGGLLARTDSSGGSVSFFDYDTLGSTAGVSDASGAYVNRYAYDPFGAVLARTEELANPFEFVGRFAVIELQGGLSNMSARLYDADISRFTSIDPIRFGADANLYQYSFNAPTMLIDPSGLIPGVASGVGLSKGLGSGFRPFAGDYGSAVTDQIVGDGGFDPVAIITAPFDPYNRIPLPGVDKAINLMFDDRVRPDFIAGLCGIARSEAFGTINKSQAKQLLLLDPSLGAKASSVDGSCLKGLPGSGDADFGLGNPCAEGNASLVHVVDPNDKIPPLGFGPDNRVAIEAPIIYTIDFENIGPGSVDESGDPFPIVATAPAQRIVIADQLSSQFDFGSVRFTEFSFGGTIVPVSDGFGIFHTTVPMDVNGVQFVVQIDAEVDPATGILAVVFQALDPASGLPPDPLSGVLPPEDGTGNGMGYFKFSVQTLPTVADGTPIRNVALIKFDGNDVIPTNQVNPLDPTQGTDPAREALVTIDSEAPIVIATPLFVVDAPSPQVRVQFSEDISPSLSNGDLRIERLAPPALFTPSSFSYDANTNTATFSLPATLPDGNYRLSIASSDIADGVGHPLATDVTEDFFHFAGDADRDRTIDIGDFAVLASRFNLPGTYTQGDFDYSGQTDIGDFAVLASKFNTSLPAPSSAQPRSLPSHTSISATDARSVDGFQLRKKRSMFSDVFLAETDDLWRAPL